MLQSRDEQIRPRWRRVGAPPRRLDEAADFQNQPRAWFPCVHERSCMVNMVVNHLKTLTISVHASRKTVAKERGTERAR